MKTSPSVFQTPSLLPSTYGTTSEQTTTLPHQAFVDSVDLIAISTATDNENNGKLLIFFASFAQTKPGWKKYLVHLYKCVGLFPPFPPTTNPTMHPSTEPASNPLTVPSTERSSNPSNEPSISSLPSSSNPPTSIPSVSYAPSPTILEKKNHNFQWEIITSETDRIFDNEDQIVQGFKTFLSHLFRCKSDALIKDVKLVTPQGQENPFLKGVCFGFRKSCIINLFEDECNDNSLIDKFVAERMSAISSSFDYQIDLSVSFDFDTDDISVVPDFLSELIEGVSVAPRAMANSNGPPDVNNEATLTINKGSDHSNFKNQAKFEQYAINFEGLVSLSTKDFSIIKSNLSDDANTDSYYGTASRRCGNACVNENLLVRKIFTIYEVNFNATIDACFWDDINCIDDSVTQIFLRKYRNHFYY